MRVLSFRAGRRDGMKHRDFESISTAAGAKSSAVLLTGNSCVDDKSCLPTNSLTTRSRSLVTNEMIHDHVLLTGL